MFVQLSLDIILLQYLRWPPALSIILHVLFLLKSGRRLLFKVDLKSTVDLKVEIPFIL